MSPSRGLAASAVWMLSVLCATAAVADSYDNARRSIDLAPDPIERSPRLQGMGRLTLADDPHNRITLWDFAADPVGILDADSVSTFHLWPNTSSRSATHEIDNGTRQRETLAAREIRLNYEAWKRTESSAYGFFGDVASLRLDHPYDDESELRDMFAVPRVAGVLNGRIPYFQSHRWTYVLHARYAPETETDEYRKIVSNGSGEYLGRQGGILPTPDIFTPDEVRTYASGGGASLSYRLPFATAALGGDIASLVIKAENDGQRYFSGTREHRPYYTGQLSAVGGLPNLQWGATGRLWSSSSHERWNFTLAGAINQAPLAGRGKRLERDEDGNDGRVRIRWTMGPVELGSSYGFAFRRVTIDPPGPDKQPSFNYFLNTLPQRQGADSLALPDSVVHDRIEEKGVDGALGGTLRLPRQRGLVGAEFHWTRDRVDQSTAGRAPDRRIWDVRGGAEYRCTPVLSGRVGYIYRSEDRDKETLQNEFVSHTVTAGLGLEPRGSIWTMDAGYSIEWLTPDYPDPSESRESRQTLSLLVGWRF